MLLCNYKKIDIFHQENIWKFKKCSGDIEWNNNDFDPWIRIQSEQNFRKMLVLVNFVNIWNQVLL